MRLWYENQRKTGTALPLGNGKLGAMVFGRAERADPVK